MTKKVHGLLFVVYHIICIGFLVSLPYLTEWLGTAPFDEGAMVETLQTGLLFIVAVVAISAAQRAHRGRIVLWMLAFFAALCFIREHDSLLDKTLPRFGWQLPAYAVFFVGLFLLFRHRKAAWRELNEFIPSVPFLVLWFGVVIVFAVSQLIGHGDLLRAIMEEYDYTVKRILEESLETFGHLVLLVGTLETVFWSRSAPPDAGRTAELSTPPPPDDSPAPAEA
jgi:hypothetical protein